jgi:RHS repeat-associated protein
LTLSKSKKSTCRDYRFGFNGQEKDNEIKGTGNSLDFGARIYDSRLGRWLSLDPLQAKYSSMSAYNFAANSPVRFIDVDGKYYFDPDKLKSYTKDYPYLVKYISTMVEKDVTTSPTVMSALARVNPEVDVAKIKQLVHYSTSNVQDNNNIEIRFEDQPGEGFFSEGAAGWSSSYESAIHMNAKYAKYLNNMLSDNNISDRDKMVAMTRFYSTLLHETGNVLQHYRKIGSSTDGNKQYEYVQSFGIDEYDDKGYQVQEDVYGNDNYKPYTGVFDPSARDDNSSNYKCGVMAPEYHNTKGITENIVDKNQATGDANKVLPTLPK